jgi:FkbM family methyltransferase
MSFLSSLRYQLGRLADGAETTLLNTLGPRLLRRYPLGRHWPFDLARFLGRSPELIVDAGANTGMTTLYLRGFFPSARIHALEPVNATFQILKKQLAADRQSHAHRLALGDCDRTQKIAVDPMSEKSTLAGTETAGRTHEEVLVRRLDTWAPELGFGTIDLLKIDVQGYEPRVLAGAEGLLRKKSILSVYIEAGFNPQDAETCYFPMLHEILISHGFLLSGFYEPFCWGSRKQHLGFCNALYFHTQA